MTSSFCKGFTQKNICCTNRADTDQTCMMHKKKYDECCICMDDMFVKEKLVCGHSFCKNCIYAWKSNTCPLCRSPLFFIAHNKKIIIDTIELRISNTDEKIRDGTIDEKTLRETIHELMNKMWLYAYDKKYLEIIYEYLSHGLRMNKKLFLKQFKILRVMAYRLENLV